ncbi:CarboxypepD_reg-like domain-containing protein [Belliella pelovolcani]|uniref:CarboxypepD_reg-like domain-containing protein n=1 Tax=Belliella pelovolcani TaxID=529505 RepID=A0A1N7JUD6_9BACT|nr:CarboxypepD_reg-like domain-containing protein [Belliella pelovolcani]
MNLVSNSLTLLIFLIVSISNNASSQQSLKLSGLIIDRDTQMPIPYTNIGIKNKFIGTVSDHQGYFSIELSESTNSDTIEISRIGYEKIKAPIAAFGFSDSEPIIISIKQNMIDLNEFTVNEDYIEGQKSFGILPLKSRFAFAFNPMKSDARANLGRELGIEIDPDGKEMRVNEVSFAIQSNQIGHITYRVNIYKEDAILKDKPGEKVSEKIYEVTEKGNGVHSVSLKSENIILSEKSWVTIEFVDFHGENVRGIVTLPVKFPLGKYLSRESSLGEWNSVMGRPSIKVDVEIMDFR